MRFDPKHPNFMALTTHIHRLIDRATLRFKTPNKIHAQEYALYLAFCLVIDDDHTSFIGIDHALQILLANPQQFWFDNQKINFSNNHERTVKQMLIRYIILQSLETFLNEAKDFKNKEKFIEFTAIQKSQFEKQIQQEETMIHVVLQQNMDFVLPKTNNQHYFQMISLFGASLSGLVNVFGNVFTIHDLINDYMREMDLQRFSPKLAVLAVTGGSYLFSELLYNVINEAMETAKKLSPAQSNRLQKSHIADFQMMCQESPTLRPLIDIRKVEIDNIWQAVSHLKENKAPIFLRHFMHKELKYLEDEMDNSTAFIKLLANLATCDKIPSIKDSAYSTPIDLLKNPNFWVQDHRELKNLDCSQLILKYVQLALLEYLGEALERNKDYSISEKASFKNNLARIHQACKGAIEMLNAQALHNLVSLSSKFRGRILFDIIICATGMIAVGVAREIVRRNAESEHGILMAFAGGTGAGAMTLFGIPYGYYKLSQMWRASKSPQVTVAQFENQNKDKFSSLFFQDTHIAMQQSKEEAQHLKTN